MLQLLGHLARWIIQRLIQLYYPKIEISGPDHIPRTGPVLLAVNHAGKSYDFEFDFFSSDKLVCSEDVYRAFDGDISLPLVDVMGRKTLPPIEIVRQCVRERTKPPAQFSFVAWLQSDEKRGRVSFGGEEEFYKSAEWSGMDLAPRR